MFLLLKIVFYIIKNSYVENKVDLTCSRKVLGIIPGSSCPKLKNTLQIEI